MAEKKGVGHAYNVDFLNVVFAASSLFLDQARAGRRIVRRGESERERRHEEDDREDRRGATQERRGSTTSEKRLAGTTAEGARQPAPLPRLEKD